MRPRLLFEDIFEPPNETPMLVVLNYSGGVQSHCIARKILRGEMARPPCPFIVVAADPGNEYAGSYEFRDRTFSELSAAGIPALIADGPKMLDDLRNKKADGGSHIDQPANWTEDGGQLPQHCTRHYKIRPMDRCVSEWIKREMGLKRWETNSVERWIGFAWDETNRAGRLRMDDHRQQARFPLIDQRMTRGDVDDWYADTGERKPCRSVCNHCWANGVATFKRIHDTDSKGWETAKEYDETSRDLTQFGVNQNTYCSRTRVSLQTLEDNGFALTGRDADALSCDSGYCTT